MSILTKYDKGKRLFWQQPPLIAIILLKDLDHWFQNLSYILNGPDSFNLLQAIHDDSQIQFFVKSQI